MSIRQKVHLEKIKIKHNHLTTKLYTVQEMIHWTNAKRNQTVFRAYLKP